MRLHAKCHPICVPILHTGSLFTIVQSQLAGLSLYSPAALEYGDFAEYECHYINCTGNLDIFINGNNRPSSLISVLDPQRDYGHYDEAKCDNSTKHFVIKFWMLINHRTLDSVETIKCEYSRDNTYNNDTYGLVEVSINKDNITYPLEGCSTTVMITAAEYNSSTEDDVGNYASKFNNGCLKQTAISVLLFFLTCTAF